MAKQPRFKSFRPYAEDSSPPSRTFKGTKQARGYGGTWERLSKQVRAEEPVCQICGDAPSTEVDHIEPFDGVDDPLRLDRENLQAVCSACHNKKTRGQRR